VRRRGSAPAGRLSHARKGRPPRARVDWAWFFDIDGTLLEIASSPWGVVVDSDLPPLVRSLHELTGGAVALITGRSIEGVDQLLPLEGMVVAGQHGLEIRSAAGVVSAHGERERMLDHVRDDLQAVVARHPGLVLELKGLTIALHYRHAPRLAGYAHRVMRDLRSRYVPGYGILKGKRVVELAPAGKDKGIAIQELMGTYPFAGRRPVFIGDDVTDEDGFRVVNAMDGISVKVGPGRTSARFRLDDVKSLRDWVRSGVEASAGHPARPAHQP
jgi:trehalose 6-phosphate phosphatase